MRAIAGYLALAFTLMVHPSGARSGDDLAFKLCTPSNMVWPSFGTSDGEVKEISALVRERLQGAGIWTESHDGMVRNMFGIRMTTEPTERRFYVLEATYWKMVVLVPMVGKLLKGGKLSGDEMDPGVSLARTWERMEFGQVGTEAKLLAHIDRMTEVFIEEYQRAQRTDACRWLRRPEKN